MSMSSKDVLKLAGSQATPQGHFDPALQPAIVTTPTKGVTIILEPPTDSFTLNFLKKNNMYVLPEPVTLKFGKWHLFLNQFYNARCVEGVEFQLTHNFNVDDFLKVMGITKKTLKKIMESNLKN